MRNFDHDFFFTKKLTIAGASELPLTKEVEEEKTDLQFFPEGGHWTDGLMGKVGYKAIGPDGMDKDIKGYIHDFTGESCGHFGNH